MDDDALDVLAADGYDPVFGARPVKRAIQRDLENPIAKEIIAGKFPPGSRIIVGARNGKLSIARYDSMAEL